MTTDLDLDSPELITALEEQERRLIFRRFDNTDAWNLGSSMVTAALARELPLVIDIRRNGHQLFHVALPGTTPDNDVWVQRKVNTVNRFSASSFLVGRRLNARGGVLSEAVGIEPIAHASHGGAFPIRVADVGVVGTIAVSGLPQAVDHAFVVERIERYLADTGQL